MIFRKHLFLLCLLGLAVFTGFSCPGFAIPPKKNPIPSDFHTGITWQEAQKNDKPIIVNFYVDWCGACKRFAPVFDKMRKLYESQYNFVIVKADSPMNREIVRDFYIPGYPTVYFVNNKENKKMRVDTRKLYDSESFKQEVENFFR